MICGINSRAFASFGLPTKARMSYQVRAFSQFNDTITSMRDPPVASSRGWRDWYDGSKGPLIDLAQAAPAYKPHPKIVQNMIKCQQGDLLGYGAGQGELELREEYAKFMSTVVYSGATIEPENVHITSGCNQAFHAVTMSIAGPGDEVIVTRPVYFNHETTLQMHGVTVKYAGTSSAVPTADDISRSVTPKTKAVVLTSPNNPSGYSLSDKVLNDVYDLCEESGIWLIIDETYRDFLSPGQDTPHTLFLRDTWSDVLISLYSFSKGLAIPGVRLGAVTTGSPGLSSNILKIMDNIQIMAPRPAQAGIAPMLFDEDVRMWQAEKRAIMHSRLELFEQVMADVPGYDIIRAGGFFSWVRHPYEGESSVHVARSLAMQQGVIAIPGYHFGGGSENSYLRLSFANVNEADLQSLPSRLTSTLDL